MATPAALRPARVGAVESGLLPEAEEGGRAPESRLTLSLALAQLGAPQPNLGCASAGPSLGGLRARGVGRERTHFSFAKSPKASDILS